MIIINNNDSNNKLQILTALLFGGKKMKNDGNGKIQPWHNIHLGPAGLVSRRPRLNVTSEKKIHHSPLEQSIFV